MSHLIAIAVGPVQEFIAAARRTRDMWFGSYLLSEISKAVAKSVRNQGGQLIFPHPDTDLNQGIEAVNVANVILAELPNGEPKTVAARAKQAAQDRWLDFVRDAWEQARGAIREEIWEAQKNDVIEYYAAWVLHADPTKYPQDRGRLMRLLAGRKNCRDFPPARGRAGVPKSSLDGQRESLLKDPARERWPERFRARLRVREGEQLDVVGLVKRVAEGSRPYPSVARIAADPWVRGNRYRLGPVQSACEQLGNQVIRRLNLDPGRGHPHFEAFPFEGSAVYPNRFHELIEEAEISTEYLQPLREALNRLPQPEPYLAVLVADGDRMGAAISALPSADSNREFSRALAGFAGDARRIVNDHSGVLIYAGGDDVLAFLPVDRCLDCARELHDYFGRRLAEYGKPTLSVGIGIGHFMENLEDLLDYGRAAEKEAKAPDRDGLAVHLRKRGGSPVRVRSPWTDCPDERLARYAELIRLEAISGKLPYDLHRLAELYQDWTADSRAQALRQDVLRVIRDKQPRGGRTYMPEIETLVNERLTDAGSLSRFAEELLVARQIAGAVRQAGSGPARDGEGTS